MKKVYIVLLTVLVVLSAFVFVQAQDDNRGSKATESEVSTPTAEPAAEEKKEETVPENVPQPGTDPIKEVIDPEEEEGNDLEEEVSDSKQEKVTDPKQENVTDPKEGDDTDPKQENITDPEEEKGTDPEPEQNSSPEPTENNEQVIPATDGTATSTIEATESGEIKTELTPVSTSEATPEPTETPVPTETTELTDTPEPTPEAPVDEHIYDEVVVTIKGAQVSVTYDGQRHQASGYTVTNISNEAYQASDFIFTGAATAELYDAGIAYMGLNDGMFVNKNNKFVNVYFDIEDGFIEIYPINVEIEIIGNSETVEYDGEPHSVYGYEFRQVRPESPQIVTAESFGLKDGKEPFAENSQVGVFGMGLNGGSFENYNPNFNRVVFSVTDGFIEITPSEKSIIEEELLAEEELLEEEILDEENKDDTNSGQKDTDQENNNVPAPASNESLNSDQTISDPNENKTVLNNEEQVSEENKEQEQVPAEPTENKAVFGAGTVILSAPDEAADVLLTVEEDTEFTVLGTNESGWIEIQINDTKGYLFKAAETDQTDDTDIEKEPVSDESEEPVDDKEITNNENNDVQDKTVTLQAGTMIYAAPDEASEVAMTLEEDAEFTILSSDVSGWAVVQSGEDTVGYLFVGEAQEENPEAEPKTEEAETLTNSLVTLPAGTLIYAAPDETSEAVMTLEEDAEFTILSSDVPGWAVVQSGEDTVGYLFVGETQEENPEAEPKTEEAETLTNSLVTLPAGTLIYAAPDETSEAVMTIEEDAEFTISSSDVTGWAIVKLNGETVGYIPTDNIPEESNSKGQQVMLYSFKAGTEFLAAPEESAEVAAILETDAELTILSVDDSGWAEVQLGENLIGYIFLEEFSAENKKDTEEDEYQLLIPAGTVIRANADGMSDIIYTPEEDIFVKILERTEDWIKVETKDGITGFVFHDDVQLDEESDKEKETKSARVLIFTSRRAIMDLGEEIKLTSIVEGIPEDITLKYQWEVDKGNGFEPAEGGNEDSYTYTASVESLAWSWRLVVSY